jgi:fructokinase
MTAAMFVVVLLLLFAPNNSNSFHHLAPQNIKVSALWGDRKSQSSAGPSPSVVCLGDALFDCIANDDARGLSVEEMVKRKAWTPFPGGAPANVATACCKLGTRSAFVGCVGADHDGDELEAMFREIGVDVTLLQRTTGSSPTRRVMVTRSEEGDREFGGFYGGRGADAFADCQLDSKTLLLECHAETSQDSSRANNAIIIDTAKWIVSSTLSLAFEKSADSIHQLVDRGLEGGARLYVDINWRPVFWPSGSEEAARAKILGFAQRAHIVKMTDEEAEWLLGVPMSEALSDPSRIHKEFPCALGVLVTAGEKGASYSLLGSTGRVEPFRVDVQETTGAGDAFTAGILHGLLSLDMDLGSFETEVSADDRSEVVDQIVRFAAAVGALTCTKEGAIAAQPSFAEVESFLIHGEKVWA